MTAPPPYGRPLTPSLVRIAAVASALGDPLRKRVVFIGGAILPLLQREHDLFGSPRATKDVDGVVATTRYTDKARIEATLRDRGFRHDVTPTHMDRWIAPEGTVFDLVSCGAHVGGTGNAHDAFAIETAEWIDLPPVVRHANAVGYLLLKCAAFCDRGAREPLQSKDLADIVSLVATRPDLIDTLRHAPEGVRSVVRTQIRWILDDRRAASSIATHIADRDPLVDHVEDRVRDTLRALTE